MRAQPELTFACELDPTRLADLFAQAPVVEDLLALRARVALMLSDFSDVRAQVVRQLNAAGVPVVAIPLLPLAEGYYFTTDNAAAAARRYEQWQAWTRQQGLVWAGVGLDIEPDARIYRQIMDNPWGLVPMLLPRLSNSSRPQQARLAYQELVDRIRADGWTVENYQFPLIAEERLAGSTLLQRLALVDVATDREIWMIYSSFMRTLGPGFIESYGPAAASIGVGTTGGGPDVPGSPQLPSLSWEELARDLRLARRWCDQILIHSLEGCVRQGFLPRLRSFDWSLLAAAPPRSWPATGLRRLLLATLWTSAHPWTVLGIAAASYGLARLRSAGPRGERDRTDRTGKPPSPC